MMIEINARTAEFFSFSKLCGVVEKKKKNSEWQHTKLLYSAQSVMLHTHGIKAFSKINRSSLFKKHKKNFFCSPSSSESENLHPEIEQAEFETDCTKYEEECSVSLLDVISRNFETKWIWVHKVSSNIFYETIDSYDGKRSRNGRDSECTFFFSLSRLYWQTQGFMTP